jgi:hypothetical protein
MSQAYLDHIYVNSAENSNGGQEIANWARGVYPKKFIQSYALNDQDKISVDSDLVVKKRGCLMSKNDIKSISDFISEGMMVNFLLKNK